MLTIEQIKDRSMSKSELYDIIELLLNTLNNVTEMQKDALQTLDNMMAPLVEDDREFLQLRAIAKKSGIEGWAGKEELYVLLLENINDTMEDERDWITLSVFKQYNMKKIRSLAKKYLYR